MRVLQLGRRVLSFAGDPGLTVGVAVAGVGLATAAGLDVRVNGSPATADTLLRDGDVVTLIPRIRGGAAPHTDANER